MYKGVSYFDVIQALNVGHISKCNRLMIPAESDVQSVLQEVYKARYFIYTESSLYFLNMNCEHEWEVLMLPKE